MLKQPESNRPATRSSVNQCKQAAKSAKDAAVALKEGNEGGAHRPNIAATLVLHTFIKSVVGLGCVITRRAGCRRAGIDPERS
jgi:hypothetical protein